MICVDWYARVSTLECHILCIAPALYCIIQSWRSSAGVGVFFRFLLLLTLPLFNMNLVRDKVP